MENTINYLGYSFDEMQSDYNFIDSYDCKLNDKKILAAKYNVGSNKAGEIKNAILCQMREERKTRKAFTKDDVTMYWRIDVVDKKKLPLEGMDFIVYLKDFLWNNLVEKGLDKKVAWAKGRDWNYRMSASQRYTIMSYLTVAEYLTDNDPKVMQDRVNKAEMIDVIKLKLIEQTGEFHDEFIERAKNWAEKTYAHQTKIMDKYQPLFDDVSNQIRSLGSSFTYKSVEYDMYTKLNDQRKEYRKHIDKAQAVLRFTLSEFIKKVEEDAESSFNTNITALATKISDKGLDATKIKVNRIDDDPKYFELCVTDGTTTLYARSILAAEWSEKVTAHFRFIITDRKNTTNK